MTAVELRLVPDLVGVVGVGVGAVPDGADTGAGAGDEVGVVDVWVGFVGDATGVEGPVVGVGVGCGEEVGAGVGVGVGVGAGVGAGAPVVAGSPPKRNAFPLLSTATQDAPGEHETAFRLPRRSSSVGVDHAEPS